MTCHGGMLRAAGGDSVYRHEEWVTVKVGLLHWYPIFFNLLCKIDNTGSRQGVAVANFGCFYKNKQFCF